MAKISSAWITKRAAQLGAIRAAMVAGAAEYVRILGELATGAAELQASIASAEASRVNPRQLPLIDAGPPVVSAPAVEVPWKPSARGISLLCRIQRDGADTMVPATDKKTLFALRAHGLVEPKALSVTDAGMAHIARDVGE